MLHIKNYTGRKRERERQISKGQSLIKVQHILSTLSLLLTHTSVSARTPIEHQKSLVSHSHREHLVPDNEAVLLADGWRLGSLTHTIHLSPTQLDKRKWEIIMRKNHEHYWPYCIFMHTMSYTRQRQRMSDVRIWIILSYKHHHKFFNITVDMFKLFTMYLLQSLQRHHIACRTVITYYIHSALWLFLFIRLCLSSAA